MECHSNNNIRTINFKDAFGENSNIYDVFGDLLSIEEEGPTYEIPIQPLEPERDCSALMAEAMKNRKTNFQHLVKQAEEEGLYIPEYKLDKDLSPGQYFVRVTAKNSIGEEQRSFDYYVSREEQKYYGIKCFYVHEDGSIEEEEYIE